MPDLHVGPISEQAFRCRRSGCGTGRRALKKSDDEKVKLTANYLNSIAIAVLVVGGLTLLISFLTLPAVLVSQLMALTAICALVSATLHLVARLFLERLDQ